MKKKFLISITLVVLACISHYSFYYFVANNKDQIKQLINWKNKQGISVRDQEIEGLGTYLHTYKVHGIDLELIVAKAASLSDDEDLGTITSVDISDIGNFRIFFSRGFFLKLDRKGQALQIINLNSILTNLYIEDHDAGIRGGVWFSDRDVALYHTKQDEKGLSVAISTLRIDGNKSSVVDNRQLARLNPYPGAYDGEVSSLGGGIAARDNTIYLALGTGASKSDPEAFSVAQSDSSYLGHIIKIKVQKSEAGYLLQDIEPYSKGHRNPQGLKFIKERLIAVEHGPRGGDEVNIIEPGSNYGWPKFSHGIPYNEKLDVETYRQNGPYKSPIYYFTPSLGISDLTDCPFSVDQLYSNCILISSMKSGTYHILKYEIHDTELRILSDESINFGDRIRKILSGQNRIYLFTDSLFLYEIEYIRKRPR